jgi:hypothetical protein
MAYSARVVHRIRGRLRLQLEDAAFTKEDLIDTTAKIRSVSPSVLVRFSPLTRTLLLEDKQDALVEAALRKIQDEKIIRLVSQAEIFSRERSSLRPRLMRQQADRFLRSASEGALDSKRLFALTLGGVGIVQALGGKFLPAGLTLLFYSAGMLDLDEYGHHEQADPSP